jgi:ATP/maltotriose-dependent transcriptional regulator MalT
MFASIGRKNVRRLPLVCRLRAASMSMNNDALRTFREDDQNPEPLDAEQYKGAFHFEIDGHEFIALDRNAWSSTTDETNIGGTTSSNMLGEIVTSSGRYVVFADNAPETTEPKVADLLSRRELQVALLIADGSCDKEIARHLAISVYTVREHIRRIFAKLNVCRRAGIIARILKH